MATLSDDEMALIRRALDEADDALGSLRRGFGAGVGGLCYPARNTVLEALRVMTLKGYTEGNRTDGQ